MFCLKRASLGVFLTVAFFHVFGLDAWAPQRTSYVETASAERVAQSLEGRGDDSVVYFFAPWCPNCRQFDYIWDEIANALQQGGKKSVQLSKFDCEKSHEHARLCTEAGVDRYPSVIYFSERALWKSGGEDVYKVQYLGDLYFEALKDWIAMMADISWWKGLFDGVGNLLSGRGWFGEKPRRSAQPRGGSGGEARGGADPMMSGAGGQEGRQSEAAGEGAGLPEGADAFLAMADLEGGDLLALQTCIADVALQYCESVEDGSEAFCELVEHCYTEGFEPAECRPSGGCPFQEQGCQLVNLCTAPSALADYKELLRGAGVPV